jgi:hypothetical protein
MSFETPEALAQELILFVDNDGEINRSQTQSILKNLMTKIGQGRYDHGRAVDLFMYLAESGAKKYAREFGSPGAPWHDMFPIEIRRMAATHWRDEFEENAKNGEYDSLLPKKYQKSAPKKQSKSSKRASSDYRDGQKAAQHVASKLSAAEIESIVRDSHVYGVSGSLWKPEFKRGYLNQMAAILNAMKGN